MPSNFPTSLDSYAGHNPGDIILDTHVDNVEDAIEAIEATVGITGSAVATSHDARIAVLEALRREQIYNVQLYGAAGVSAATDTTAFQDAIDDAIANNGTIIVPELSAAGTAIVYLINSTLTFAPAGGRAEIKMIGGGLFYNIAWTGGDSDVVFDVRGLRNSIFEGLKVLVQGDLTASGVVVWEVDDDATRAATNGNTWKDCHVNFHADASSGFGWRVGHTGSRDISGNLWDTCTVSSSGSAADGHIGWSIEHQNVLVCTWLNCFTAFLATGWTNKSSSGAASSLGGPGHTFLGCGGTNNNLEFEFYSPGPYVIHGGRWEVGETFISVPRGESPAAMSVDVAGVDIGWTSAPPSDILVNIQASCSLAWNNNNVYGFDATAAMITINTGTGHAILTAHGGGVQRASDGAISTLTAVATYKDVHLFRTDGVNTQSILTS